MDADLYDLHADLEATHWWFVARRQIMTGVLTEVLPPSKQKLVIDVGCGTGANIAHLANLYKVVGMDTEDAAIAHARRRFPDVQFVRGEFPTDFSAARYADAFLFMDVLEHIEDEVGFLHKWIAAARPGAIFLVTVPADPALWSVHDEKFGHYRRYTVETLRSVWQAEPVRELMLSAFNARLYPMIKLARAWGRLIKREQSDLQRSSRLVNNVLQRIFAGELARLRAATHGVPGYSRGVSLMTVLQKQ